MSTIVQQTAEWRLAKAAKFSMPREWLDDDGYVRPEFLDAHVNQLRALGSRGYEGRTFPPPSPGGERTTPERAEGGKT